jgi:predicted metal-dependent enzyme (double-stranded beta helix superfamily)
VNDSLRSFISAVESAVGQAAGEAELLARVKPAMAALVARDDWLPEMFAQPHTSFYQQYLLYGDPQARFSIVSFVWGPGQHTPVHDHTVWGVIGMLRGSELAQGYRVEGGRLVEVGEAERLRPGDVTAVSPAIGDVHRVSNALENRVSISIHVYGADIGRTRRHVFDLATGSAKELISGYANRSKGLA